MTVSDPLYWLVEFGHICAALISVYSTQPRVRADQREANSATLIAAAIAA